MPNNVTFIQHHLVLNALRSGVQVVHKVVPSTWCTKSFQAHSKAQTIQDYIDVGIISP